MINKQKNLPKVALVQMVYNGMKYIPQSFAAMVNQTYSNKQIVAVINGNLDGGKEYIQKHFPEVLIIDKNENLNFVRGHNLIFDTIDAEFFQLVNQDCILEKNYVEEMVKVFLSNKKVGAANGKIYQYNFDTKTKSNLLDTTGIIYRKSGGGGSRGQNQEDTGQFDDSLDIISVDGSSCMYRKLALEDVVYVNSAGYKEYFDLDFEMYWEDVDLGLRMTNAGWFCKFIPSAVGYHGRTAGASPGGYKKIFTFIQHHKKIPQYVKDFNYKNHIFLFIKNSPKFYWQFFVREFFYQIYVLFLETQTLKTFSTFLKQLPKMWRKRKYIRQKAKITHAEFEAYLK